MPPAPDPKQEFIQDFGDAYQHFGLSALMGRIVGLLLHDEGPLSLDDIATELKVSKGPVSQITRRLMDHGLLRKVWVPGSRRDHYEAEDGIFLRAFANHADLLGRNLALAEKYAAPDGGAAPTHFDWRVAEMRRFYELMGEHLQRFMTEWSAERETLAAARAAADSGTRGD